MKAYVAGKSENDYSAVIVRANKHLFIENLKSLF